MDNKHKTQLCRIEREKEEERPSFQAEVALKEDPTM
jgi:uncharacterized protein YabE (DUF348 family)